MEKEDPNALKQTESQFNAENKEPSKRSRLLQRFNFSRKQSVLVVALIAVVGSVFLYHSLAATSVQGLKMVEVVGQPTKLTWNAYAGAGAYKLAIKTRDASNKITSTTYVQGKDAVVGTTYYPKPVPNTKVSYGILPVKADGNTQVTGSTWATEVFYTWPSNSVDPPAPSTEPTAPTITHAPALPANNNMIVGLTSATSWGQTIAYDTKNIVNYVRLEDGRTSSIGIWKNAGIKVVLDFTGNYNSNGVSGLGDPTTWARNQLAKYKSVGCDPTWCPMIEVLNEPAGTWFWGSNAYKETNQKAYAKLVKATYDVFHSAPKADGTGGYGSTAPKILATFDGSYNNGDPIQFGKGWWTIKENGVQVSDHSKVDGIIVHPYGGKSDVTKSAEGNRALVTSVYDYTYSTGDPKHVYITEFGWPTGKTTPDGIAKGPTGDSLQWTEAQQANNLYNFINWARSVGYVDAAIYFQYRDYISVNKTTGAKTYMWYGVTRDAENTPPKGSKKPGWNALGCAAQKKTWNSSSLTCN